MRAAALHWLAGLACGLIGAAAAQEPALARPQLDTATAAGHQIADYLAQGPAPWLPASVDAARWTADFIVAADGSGTHRSLQAAVDAVPARVDGPGAQRPWVIRIRPGVYRGPLCMQDKAPIRLTGEPGLPGAVTLVDGRYNALPKSVGVPAQPCRPQLDSDRHGTSGSATVVIASPDVLLAHLTIANDATRTGQPPIATGAQAVALLTLADHIQLEQVRLVSHQDTFYVRRPAPTAPARVYVRGSVIEGDVDFVFGNATLVIDDSTLVSRSDRLGAGRAGVVLAPSTPADAALGFLVTRSRFVADADLPPGSVALGRAWDEGVAPGTWRAGVSPNGQALVRDSALGPHIGGWAASTSGRPFSSPRESASGLANRLTEYRNTALPRDIARETLPAGDGWGADGGGARADADAAPQDVHGVRKRAELVAALRPHPRPRIVKLLAASTRASPMAPSSLVRACRGDAVEHHDSLVNGQPADLVAHLVSGQPGVPFGTTVGWTPAQGPAIDAADQVPGSVRAAGYLGRQPRLRLKRCCDQLRLSDRVGLGTAAEDRGGAFVRTGPFVD